MSLIDEHAEWSSRDWLLVAAAEELLAVVDDTFAVEIVVEHLIGIDGGLDFEIVVDCLRTLAVPDLNLPLGTILNFLLPKQLLADV